MRMKKVAVFLFSLTFVFLLLHPTTSTISNAEVLDRTNVYTIKSDDTSLKIAVKFGVSELELKSANGKKETKLQAGDKIVIPETISIEEKELLARLVHAEAKGEPYEGKVAVAKVVLNRVESEEFPDSIKNVIYEKRQFEPVENGMINKPADDEAKKAVNEALARNGQGTQSLYFFNPEETSSRWLRTRVVTEVIGNHLFAT